MPIDKTLKHIGYVGEVKELAQRILDNQEDMEGILKEADNSGYPDQLVDGAFQATNSHIDKDTVNNALNAYRKMKDQFEATGQEVLKALYAIRG